MCRNRNSSHFELPLGPFSRRVSPAPSGSRQKSPKRCSRFWSCLHFLMWMWTWTWMWTGRLGAFLCRPRKPQIPIEGKDLEVQIRLFPREEMPL